MKKYIPDAVTALRFVGSAAIMIIPALTVPFFTVYAVCVLFDYLDGFLARKLDAKSCLGERLDHIASIVFIVVLIMRFLSVVKIPAWSLIILMGIAILKCASLVFGAVRYKKAAFINSDWNKWAKAVIYLSPFWYWFAGPIFTSVIVIVVLLTATVEELVINVTSKEYNPDVKTIIHIDRVFKSIKKKFKKK